MNKTILFVPKLGKNGDTKSESFLRRSYFTDKQLFRIPFFRKLSDSTSKN